MSSSLKCNSCTFASSDIHDAMEHVGVSLGHVMSAQVDDEGTTITVSLDEDEDVTDDWDEDVL
jgi:hypothetical protein